ncbi:MAG: helix-turn-helix domain-containing protein [Kiritimatiellia bacterium]|jgi:hypothetical protein
MKTAKLSPTLENMVAAWQPATLPQRRAALVALQSDAPAPSAAPDEILTRKQVAERFHRHPSFVDRAVRKGLLRPWNPGGRWKRAPGFRASDVAALMEGGEV